MGLFFIFEASLNYRTTPRRQSEPPDTLYALLHLQDQTRRLLPLNYSVDDPAHIQLPWPPAQLAVTFDSHRGQYLLFPSGVSFLTPSWDTTPPSWQSFYVWWLDPKNDAITRQLLPTGPWVTDAKLDMILGRTFRNSSCGTDCYRHYDIAVDSGIILVTITGRTSAVSERVTGTYQLRPGDTNWKKIKDGQPESN